MTKNYTLADHVAAILTDPDTPAEIHNGLFDALYEAADRARVKLDTPEVLRVALPLIQSRLAAARRKARPASGGGKGAR